MSRPPLKRQKAHNKYLFPDVSGPLIGFDGPDTLTKETIHHSQ